MRNLVKPNILSVKNYVPGKPIEEVERELGLKNVIKLASNENALGASPRASIMLTLAAKAHAFLQGRGYVTPDDVKQIGTDVLRHRVLLTYEAEAEDMTSDDIVKKIFDQVEVP